MRYKDITISLCFVLLSVFVFGQTGKQDSVKRVHEFGMNMTGLLNQVVPFKQVTDRTGPYSASYKRIGGNGAFRAGVGIHIIQEDFFDNQDDILNINLRLGYEIRRPVNEKFTFYQTFDGMAMIGNFNSPINDFDGNDQGGIGVGLGLGIEYYLFENLSISTEGIGFVGFIFGSGSIFSVTVIPPIAVFLNYKF